MPVTGEAVLLRGEQELFERASHLLLGAHEVACAANDLYVWVSTHPEQSMTRAAREHRATGKRIRKLFRPAALLEPSSAQHLHTLADAGIEVRVTPDEINETILIDQRLAILAGDRTDGVRTYSVLSGPEVVQGVRSLFEAAWRAGTELAVYDAQYADLRALAPRILDLLASGCKDETAARNLNLGVRTYRRRVAELMAALDATSRFQAGARARELGLV